MMGPPGPREAIAAAIRQTGCVLRDDPISGGLGAVDCPSYIARAELVDVLAWRDARYDGRIRQLALEIARIAAERRHRGGRLSAPELASEVQLQVAGRVRYLGEAGDVIQDAWTTWVTGFGDCDCQTRLVLALCRALGVDVDTVAFHRSDAILHVCAALRGHMIPEMKGRDRVYLETTLGPGIRFGEHPYAAAVRLGAHERRDLA